MHSGLTTWLIDDPLARYPSILEHCCQHWSCKLCDRPLSVHRASNYDGRIARARIAVAEVVEDYPSVAAVYWSAQVQPFV